MNRNDELLDILGREDASVAELLTGHAQRTQNTVDNAARNISVGVADRLQPRRTRLGGYLLGGVLTSAAAVALFFNSVSVPSSLGPSVPSSLRPSVPAAFSASTRPSVPSSLRPSVPHRSIVSTRPSVPHLKSYASNEAILEQEAEQQVVEFLAAVVSDEATWTLNNADLDRILQEKAHDNGL